MNREIKFRTWHEYHKTFHYWGINIGVSEAWFTGPPSLPKAEHQQFTGLRDKNGQEIYEGDIVRDKGYKGPSGEFFDMAVVWDMAACCFTRDTRANNHFQLSVYRCWMYEVIGNIYENPDCVGK